MSTHEIQNIKSRGVHMLNRVFLSHSHQDHEQVEPLYKNLVKLGFDVWFDEVSLQPGDNLAESIETGIVAANFVVIALTPRSIMSEWVKQEAFTALRLEYDRANIVVVPILMEECDVPNHLGKTLYANLTSKETQQFEFGRLLSVFYQGMKAESCSLRLVSLDADISSCAEHPHLLYGPANVRYYADESEDRTYWLLPDHTSGKLTVKLSRPQHVRLIRVLNTQNWNANDRASDQIAIKAYLQGQQPRMAWEGALPRYPDWFDLWLSSWYVDTITIEVRTWVKYGGGLNTVQAYAAH